NECLCVLPRRVEGAHTQNRVSIEGVEQIEVHCRPRPPEAEQFADTEVDLIQPLAIQRRWLDHVDVHRLGTARETPPETGYGLGIRIRAGCRDAAPVKHPSEGSGHALERPGDLYVNLRKRIRRESPDKRQ